MRPTFSWPLRSDLGRRMRATIPSRMYFLKRTPPVRVTSVAVMKPGGRFEGASPPEAPSSAVSTVILGARRTLAEIALLSRAFDEDTVAFMARSIDVGRSNEDEDTEVMSREEIRAALG